MHWLCEQLSDFYVKEDSVIYDIGCSTGTLLKKIASRHKEKRKGRQRTSEESVVDRE